METTQTKQSAIKNPHSSQGRSLDFSFAQKSLVPKIFRLIKEQKKAQEICSSSNETRDVQITLSPKMTQHNNFTAIKREVDQNELEDFVLNNITEQQHSNPGSYVHLFSNIRCSMSSQGKEQVPKQPSIQKKQEAQIKQVSNVSELRDKTTYRISTLIKDQMTSKFVQLDFTQPNVYEANILLQKDFQTYKQEVMNIYRLSNIRIGEKQKIHFKSLKKVTVYPILMKKNQLQMQLVHSGGRVVFGSQLKRHLYFLPQHYIWCAKITNAKLMNMGHKFGNSAQILNKQVNMGWNGNFAEGFIFKKSKYLRHWQKRYVVINTQGLFSYKEVNQNYTVFIPTEDVRVLKTKFDFYQKNLVVRLQTEELKIDFGIPVHDYCLKIENNWLFAFYRLLMEYKHHIKIA